MDKTYEPAGIETRLYEWWDAEGFFRPRPGGDPFCIVIPPPNVTGTLHMGHAFQDTVMDALTRYHRMLGEDVLWQPGTDHAGIATQMVVERQLNAEGSDRHALGRDRFLERVWAWKEQSGGTISRQLRRMGASVDWSRDRFTMDEGLSDAVREAFIALHAEGLIYRGQRLVNWDPVLKTALSDLEVLSQEEQGHLWHLRYPLADGSGHLVVATTRPETMLGDSAVAVHPADERYRHLVGRSIRLPLTGRDIPIIADDYVDPEFGSGCVKITPAHDFNDYEIGQRHGLPLINVLDADARMAGEVPAEFLGLDRYEAREKVIAAFSEAGLLERIDEHRLMVPRGDRSGSVIEPWLTDQWYVRIEPLARPAIEAVEQGRIRFVPENWDRTYFEWMRNIKDWCISRQLWWGHRIPAWYDPEGRVFVGRDEAAVREAHGIDAGTPLRQDEDVLDTWFSSALWPFSTLGWPDKTPELARYYPTSVLVTGFDIIFFWVARMIMMGLKFTGEVPFREVYIHGLIRDHEGQKMSKSKGNVIDPLDIVDGIDLPALLAKRTTGLMQPHLAPAIEKATRKQFPKGIAAYGMDALRLTFASMATQSRDLRFDLGRVEGYRNFCNKLWNAARYVMMAVGESSPTGPAVLSTADRWARSRLDHAIREVRAGLDGYRLDLAAQAAYEFTWYEFCDWYLELSKAVLQADTASEAEKTGTRQTLLAVLESLLRLLHPIMPFITEEIWQRVAPLAGTAGPSIMLQPFPEAHDDPKDADAAADMRWAMDFILGVRQIRGEMDIAPSVGFEVLLQDASPVDLQRWQASAAYVRKLANVTGARALGHDEAAPPAAVALMGQLKILVPMAGLIDVEAELARLGKKRDKAAQDKARSEAKLSRADFVDHAPEAIVAQERERLAVASRELEQLEQQLEKVALLR
ncbi:MAG: valine--tRNA ligase [Steroidobacteraceae bacterium]